MYRGCRGPTIADLLDRFEHAGRDIGDGRRAERALYHLEQAPDPCHTCGGKSSMTTASSAHGEFPVLNPPRVNVSAHSCAIRQ